MRTIKIRFFFSITAISLSMLSGCKVRSTEITNHSENKTAQILDNPSESAELAGSELKSANTEPLITYCTKETAPAATPDEKKWREAFSLEVMERICDKDAENAKLRIEYSDWTKSRYLETSWAAGINVTGVTHGWPRGTAITSRHIIYTKHYGFHGQKGDTLWFLTMDNRLITRKVIDFKYLNNPDVAIIQLDSDLPGSIAPLKLLDPKAAELVPNLVPMLRIEQQSKALLVQKEAMGVGMPGAAFGTLLINPPERAFAQYYQNMVRFDSSSPTILLLRNEYGVMPILYSLVTMGGVGIGPILHTMIGEIQQTIASFGDPHKVELAMPPVTPFSAPSCSVSVSRADDGLSCHLSVVGSADPVTGDPVVTPESPSNWTRKVNTWQGSVKCPSDPNYFFQVTLRGPGGTGRTCESGPIGPILPRCKLNVSRQGSSATCDVEVTRLLGSPTGNPSLSPINSSNWDLSGDRWTTTISCAQNTPAKFTAKLTDEAGTGPECESTVPALSEIPTCEITSKRIGYSDKCELVVTRKSGIASGEPSLGMLYLPKWTQSGDQYKTTVPCPIESNSNFLANLSGPAGTGPTCKAATVLSVPNEIPFCELSATRIDLTNRCKLNIKFTRGWTAAPPPVASPRNPTDWKKIGATLDYEGTVGCAVNFPHEFSAYYPTIGNVAGRACLSNKVEKIPGPACSLQASRQLNTNKCSFSLSATSAPGTITGYKLENASTSTTWNGSSPATGEFTCSQISDTGLSVSVIGAGATPQTGTCQTVVSKLPPPTCQLTAKRRAKTRICDLSMTGGGVIDTARAPKFSPSATGRWSGSNWSGTGVCSTTSSTRFSATIYGPGGSQASCSSSPVPRVN